MGAELCAPRGYLGPRGGGRGLLLIPCAAGGATGRGLLVPCAAGGTTGRGLLVPCAAGSAASGGLFITSATGGAAGGSCGGLVGFVEQIFQ